MRTTEERMRLIGKRTAEIRRQEEEKKRRVQDGLCLAACLILVVVIGAFLPGVVSGLPYENTGAMSGAASLVGSSEALGYIVMGLLSFVLGVCVTVLLYRLRRRNERRKQEETDDEL